MKCKLQKQCFIKPASQDYAYYGKLNFGIEGRSLPE
jgi:hypothetical protein